jgi:hypothetical protein
MDFPERSPGAPAARGAMVPVGSLAFSHCSLYGVAGAHSIYASDFQDQNHFLPFLVEFITGQNEREETTQDTIVTKSAACASYEFNYLTYSLAPL